MFCRSSGNEALDTMAFLHMLEQLKVGETLEAFPNPGVMLTLPLGTEAVGMDPRGSEYSYQSQKDLLS